MCKSVATKVMNSFPTLTCNFSVLTAKACLVFQRRSLLHCSVLPRWNKLSKVVHLQTRLVFQKVFFPFAVTA